MSQIQFSISLLATNLTLRLYFLFSARLFHLSLPCSFPAFIHFFEAAKASPASLFRVVELSFSRFSCVGELLTVIASESQIAFACFLLGRWCFDDARWKRKE
jgi:hypothetical protein